MDRFELKIPDTFPFETNLTVRISDINHGGHLGNDSLLSLLNEARVRFYAALGYTELDVAGVGTIVRNVSVRYSGEAFHGDKLSFELAVTDIGRTSFDLACRVSRQPGAVEIARAITGIVFFDYKRRRPVRTPAVFTAAVARNAAQNAESTPPVTDSAYKET